MPKCIRQDIIVDKFLRNDPNVGRLNFQVWNFSDLTYNRCSQSCPVSYGCSQLCMTANVGRQCTMCDQGRQQSLTCKLCGQITGRLNHA